jgi:hypothetical protein
MSDDAKVLKLEKRNYSMHPWRITWKGNLVEPASFRLKREAVPVFEKMLTFGDLDAAPTWDDERKREFSRLLWSTPGGQLTLKAQAASVADRDYPIAKRSEPEPAPRRSVVREDDVQKQWAAMKAQDEEEILLFAVDSFDSSGRRFSTRGYAAFGDDAAWLDREIRHLCLPEGGGVMFFSGYLELVLGFIASQERRAAVCEPALVDDGDPMDVAGTLAGLEAR